ncbi:MAG: YebC/PmpR family DNA-binding transcriptional regulator [Fimbriimonadaceae bacterium]|nr:YebC/PmpR family DNA-binding transcriptional regulator [Fimbriimonadaceae bacterium]QYK58188.1 MAG: YebC/PmpR family DNA-binding transcriptional regulator [Fimbriimonadaceae bacterium]
MAGHSKWKNIRLRKGKQDALRGKLFTKLAREIIVAAKMGGGDPAVNARLRLAIEKAKENSVPKDNIERAIAKGSGGGEGTNYEEILYEGAGPGGVAFMVEVYSDNRNRTVGELRHAFTKHGGALGENGSQAWQFKHVGQILVNKSDVDEETLTLSALEAGAEDVETDDDEAFTVTTAIAGLHACNEALNKAGIPTHGVGLTRVATNLANPSREDLLRVVKLIDALEELDDVKETFVNVEIPEELYDES